MAAALYDTLRDLVADALGATGHNRGLASEVEDHGLSLFGFLRVVGGGNPLPGLAACLVECTIGANCCKRISMVENFANGPNFYANGKR